MPLTTKCVKQTTKKYTSPKRKSPPYPANECCGETYEGNDGNTYESIANKKGVCQWKKISSKSRKEHVKDTKEKDSKKCVKQTTKKYSSPKRKSPPYSANECCGKELMGNNKKMWKSIRNKKGVCQWKQVKSPIGKEENRKSKCTKRNPAPPCKDGFEVLEKKGKTCCYKKKRSPSNKPKETNSTQKEANVVAQLKYDLIASREYEWAMDSIKTVAFFKKNERHFDIFTPIKDWKDGDVIQYNYFTPGVYGSFVSKTKIIPAFGEDYLQVPEEITKYTDDIMSMYKNLINNYTVGHTIYLSNKDAILKKFLKPSILKKVNQIKSKRPIFSISFDKLADENTIYLQVSFPPKSKKGWSKNYRITRVVGEIKINKQGKLGKGKIEDEKDLVDYIESSIGKKI
tara:strand:- start:25 stop:1224 length:1200 start_codon:yes stop_codon:yes gene_type:complete